ncbi:MAG: DUF169 domain-containing protein [Candidatus Hydrothermarchaeota archaeon]
MDWKDVANVLYKYIRLNSFPVGVKLLEKKEEIPPKTRRFKTKMNNCQLAGLARSYGWVVGATKEDLVCVAGAACVGLIETPEKITSGKISYKVNQKTLEAAKKMQDAVFRLKPIYEAILFYSIERAPMDPDVVLCYVNPAQAMRLIHASLWEIGGKLKFGSSGEYGLCGEAIAQTIIEKEPKIAVACYGDRRFGLTQDHELIFSFPAEWTERILEGLEETHKAGVRYPIPFQLEFAPQMPEIYFIEEE